MDGVSSEVDRLFDRFVGGFGVPSWPNFVGTARALNPAADIVESDGGSTVNVELPGITDKDIQVTMSGDLLTIRDEKRLDHDESKDNYHISERSYGAFHRAFTLPAGVEAANITAECANGVLTVTLPKSVPATPKTIEVKPAA